MRKVGEYTWLVESEGRQYFIGDTRDICAAAVDVGSCNNVLLLMHKGQTMSIDFASKKEAIHFFEEVGDEIQRNQKGVVCGVLETERRLDRTLAS